MNYELTMNEGCPFILIIFIHHVKIMFMQVKSWNL
jgi:hypothetical protein